MERMLIYKSYDVVDWGEPFAALPDEISGLWEIDLPEGFKVVELEPGEDAIEAPSGEITKIGILHNHGTAIPYIVLHNPDGSIKKRICLKGRRIEE